MIFIMNYFITSRQDLQTSAIELVQVKRLRIFDHLRTPETILAMIIRQWKKNSM